MRTLRLVTALFIAAGAMAFAQTATILGTVTDTTGAVVPNAKITIANTATSATRTLETNTAGNFNAPELPIGPYSVSRMLKKSPKHL
jgi:hypothetical protein